jgi:hypothetical protein
MPRNVKSLHVTRAVRSRTHVALRLVPTTPLALSTALVDPSFIVSPVLSRLGFLEPFFAVMAEL